MKISKNYANNLIEKALSGRRVGNGKGCTLVIVGEHGVKQSYTIRNFVDGSDSWFDNGTMTHFHGNWQFIRAQKSVWAQTAIKAEIELSWTA
jgi:hypothetical protein